MDECGVNFIGNILFDAVLARKTIFEMLGKIIKIMKKIQIFDEYFHIFFRFSTQMGVCRPKIVWILSTNGSKNIIMEERFLDANFRYSEGNPQSYF